MMPGFGDSATWGPYSGHPNDPRQQDDYDPCAGCKSTCDRCEHNRVKEEDGPGTED